MKYLLLIFLLVCFSHSQVVYDCTTLSDWVQTVYSEGDLVQDGEKVYQCKSWPFSQWAGLNNAYQPPVGTAWEEAWDEVGVCSASPDYIDCNDLNEWDYNNYGVGDLIVAGNFIYKCKPWPYCGWCGSDAIYAPEVGSNWDMAWNRVGSCEIFTIVATAEAGGVIVPEGAVDVNNGDDRTFYIIPNEGKSIIDVIVNGTSVGPVNTYSLSVLNSNATINAVFSGNIPPVAIEYHITVVDKDGNGSERVNLDASQSYDLDGTIVAYYWELDMGNGLITYERDTPYVVDQNELPIGEMLTTLWVTDNDGAKSIGCIFLIKVLHH